MRNQDRDRRPVWIAKYVGQVAETDEQGRLTGRHTPQYGEPQLFWPTVTVMRGYTWNEFWGKAHDYDRVVRIDDPLWWVDENAVLYIDTPLWKYGSFQELNRAVLDGTVDISDCEPDYTVKRIGHGKSYTIFTVEKIEGVQMQ
ncbi:MAG: hypothetical protein IJ092_13740 [Atopobiaceae bacterium]|nr:hypothetical protein [Atopobiaceae bacterium]